MWEDDAMKRFMRRPAPPAPPNGFGFRGGGGGGGGRTRVDVSKQHAPSPDPPLIPVIDVKVSKQNYRVDDESETMLTTSRLDTSSKRSSLSTNRLACPFWTLRPADHTSCSSEVISRVRDLKRHLLRCHKPQSYCPRCLRTFQKPTGFLEHFMEWDICEYRGDEPDFLTNKQILQLRRLRWKDDSAIEIQWYQVWDICFPGRERPSKTCIDDIMKDALATALESYRDFVSLQALHILGDVLSKSGYNGPDPRKALLTLLNNGLDAISSHWTTILEEQAKADRKPPTIESSSSASRWSGLTLAAADALDSISPSAEALGSPSTSDFSDCDREEAEWSPAEDAFLVELNGSGIASGDISDHFPGRSTHSCRRRYLDLHAKWSEELKMKVSNFNTTERYTKESEPRIDTCEQDTGTTINPARVPLGPDTNSPGCLSSTQVASSTATSTPASDDMETLSRDDGQNESHLDGSDMSEYSMLNDAVLYDSSRFSVLESAAADQLLDAYEAWSRISTFCNTSCAASEPADTPEASQTPNASSGSNASPSSSSSSPAGVPTSVATLTSQAFPKSTETQKRKRDKDGDSDDEGHPKKSRVQKRKRVEGGEKRLACPFQKRYHPGHLFCGEDRATRGFKTIANVKQHIRQSHLHPEIHCTRCKAEFDDVLEMDRHRNATPPCEELPYVDETKLLWNKKLLKEMKTRVNEKIDIDKQWFSVWELLFPDAKQPPSCRVEDDELCEHLVDLPQFMADKGGSIIDEILRNHDFASEAGESDQALEEIQRRKEEHKIVGVRILNLAVKRFIEGRAPLRGPRVARYKGHMSTTNGDDGAMTDSRVGAAALLQAPPEIQAHHGADAQLETVPGGDIPQDENGTLLSEGPITFSVGDHELDFLEGFDLQSFNMWNTT